MFYSEPNRFHHAATGCSTVPRIDINMSAPEAFWTMIGVPISFHSSAAVCTGEIFNVALESFTHRLLPILVSRLRRSKVRFRLGDTAAARSIFQCSWTNSLKSVLYSFPTLSVEPCAGSNASRTDFFLLLRASDNRNSLGFRISSVGDGIRCNGMDRKAANPIRSAITQDSTSITATRKKNVGLIGPLIHERISPSGQSRGVSKSVKRKIDVRLADLLSSGAFCRRKTLPLPRIVCWISKLKCLRICLEIDSLSSSSTARITLVMLILVKPTLQYASDGFVEAPLHLQ